MKLFKEPIIIVDTETTGFHKEAEVIEIGAICVDEWGRDRSSFSALIKPKVLNDWRVSKALEINKIKIEDLNQAGSLDQTRDLFMDWVSSIPCSSSPVCIAFNTRFDKRMLERSGIHLSWGYCLLEMTKELMTSKHYVLRGVKGRVKAPSLKDACQFFGVEYPENAHRALEDARVSALIATKIFPLWRELPMRNE